MDNKNKSMFWLETNSYFGYVSFGDDSDKNIISFNDAKNILEEQQSDDIFKTRVAIEMNNDRPSFGFKSEHTGITLKEWIDKYGIKLKELNLHKKYADFNIDLLKDNKTFNELVDLKIEMFFDFHSDSKYFNEEISDENLYKEIDEDLDDTIYVVLKCAYNEFNKLYIDKNILSPDSIYDAIRDYIISLIISQHKSSIKSDKRK